MLLDIGAKNLPNILSNLEHATKACKLKDRSIPGALKMRMVKTLVWTVMSYEAEAWPLKVRD